LAIVNSVTIEHTMLCIIRHETDPYFNLAAEEYVMEQFDHDWPASRECFMLWRNAPAIIVGRHQNTLAEINADYVRQNNIKVVRRLSGGGAVFHDLGNLNFTFIASDDHHRIDFRRFTQPILEVLQAMGVDARFEGRNDLTIGDRKFSGNAQYVRGGRVLHHGTLLFSGRMTDLSAALRVDPTKFADKAVKSVRSRVTNISEHLPEPMTVLDFRDRVMRHVMESTPGAQPYAFTPADVRAIEQLRDEKYATWEWNFGHSPRYNYRKATRTAGGQIEVALDVVNGTIEEARIFGDYFNRLDPADIETALIGAPHQERELRGRLANFDIAEYFVNVSADELMSVLI
jgi:lipoate-protein ligase A